jgi:hypothetical protein
MISKITISDLNKLLDKTVFAMKKKVGFKPVKVKENVTVKYIYNTKAKRLQFRIKHGKIKFFLFTQQFKRLLTQKAAFNKYRRDLLDLGFYPKTTKSEHTVLVRKNNKVAISVQKKRDKYTLFLYGQ